MKSFGKDKQIPKPDLGVVKRNLDNNCGQYRYMWPDGQNLKEPAVFGMKEDGTARVDKLKY